MGKVYTGTGQSSSGATTTVGDATSSSTNNTFGAVLNYNQLSTDGGLVDASRGIAGDSLAFAGEFSDAILGFSKDVIKGQRQQAADTIGAAVSGAEKLRQEVEPAEMSTYRMIIFTVAAVAALAVWRVAK